MRALTLARYDLRRLSRNRPLLIALFALPLLLALVRCIFASMEFSELVVWACPLACLALTASVLWIQHSADRVSGLMLGLRSTPISDRELLASRLIAGGGVFTVQMAILAVVSALRF